MEEALNHKIKEAELDSVDMEPEVTESPTTHMVVMDSDSHKHQKRTTPTAVANQAEVSSRLEVDKASATAMCLHPWDQRTQASLK